MKWVIHCGGKIKNSLEPKKILKKKKQNQPAIKVLEN